MLLSLESRRSRRGTVVVIVAVCLVVLFGTVAISTDGGLLQDQKRHAQSTADAAAMAAAAVLYENYPKNQGFDLGNNATQAAYDFAAENGYKRTGRTSSVNVYIPPQTGIYAGLAGYVEVNITYNQPRYFSGIFGSSDIPVRARAVARGAWVAPNAGVIVLAYSGKGTLNSQGTGSFTDVGAPVIVNSNNSTAAIAGGGGSMIAPEFDITGGYTLSGGGQLITQPTANNIYTGMHPTPDPLAYLPVPTQPPAGTMTKTSIGNGNFQYVLSPGAYYNLPNFNQGDQVIFQQASAGNGGIFYLAAGGLNSQGANLIMDPNSSGGIMIYNAGTGTSDSINITGNPSGIVNLGPLTSGVYQGLTLFQSRSATESLNIAGNGNFTIHGTLYAANALIQASGNGSVSNIGSQYVSQDLSISGNGNVTIDWAGNQVAKTRIIKLVE
jgi:hypothetical protein